MSGLKILTEAVNADPARFRWLFGLAPYPYPPAGRSEDAPAAEAEAPAEAPAGETAALEPYVLNSISVPMKDEAGLDGAS